VLITDTSIQNAKPKKQPRVITSFNEEGYRSYGKAFVDTWREFWPASIGLTIFYEGDDKAFDMVHGISWRPIEEVEFLQDFMNSLRFPILHGIVADSYDVWFDARHARKVFMEIHALRKYGGKVFWLDSDSITHSPVPESFLDECLPDEKLCCYLGRDGWWFTESGFLGFNAQHPLASALAKNYVHFFVTGAFLTNAFHGRLCWNDCGGLDALRHVVFKNSDDFVNLAKDLPQGTMHVFINSILGKYLDHKKGPRKDSRSSDSDLVIEREEPYWRNQSQHASTEQSTR